MPGSMDQDEANPSGSSTAEQKLTIGGTDVTVAGSDREPFAELIFGLHYTRTSKHISVGLTLDQVDFGVRNCCTENCSVWNPCCHKNCKVVFIYKMIFELRPKSWARGCSRLMLQPDYTAAVFQLQRSSARTIQMPLVCPGQASVSIQNANSVLRVAPEFNWCPAYRDDASNAVSLTWELQRYGDGSKLEFNKPIWWSRPPIGIRPSHTHIQSGSSPPGASWTLQPTFDLQPEQLEWDVTSNILAQDVLVTKFNSVCQECFFYSLSWNC